MLDFLFGWRKASKCKELIKCVRSRLKLLRNKRDAIVRQLRDDIAQLLINGLDQSALNRVEQLFKDQNILAVYHLLDHFCEFIIINLPYIRKQRDCPNDVNEAVSSLIFASARCANLPELQTLRKLFGERYGKDFAEAAVELFPGNIVNQQIREKLSLKTISDDAKLRLLDEIAKEYNLESEHPEAVDGCSPLSHLKVYGPSLQNEEYGLVKPISQKEIQLFLADTRFQVQNVNAKETLQIYQQRGNGLDDKGNHDSPSNCEEILQNPFHSHDNFGVDTDLGRVSVIQKCEPDVIQSFNSPSFCSSMQEVDDIDKLNPSYERVFVYSDDKEDLNISMNHWDDGNDEISLEPVHSIRKNGSRKSYEANHLHLNRSRSSDQEGNQEIVNIYCESPQRVGRGNASVFNRYSFAQELQDFGELDGGRVSSRCGSNRRKSASRNSGKNCSSKKTELYNDGADSSELVDSSLRMTKRIHDQRCSFMLTDLSKKDIEYFLYYDESWGDSDVDFLNVNQKHKPNHKLKPDGDCLTPGHQLCHSMLCSPGALHMRRPCTKKPQKKLMSGNKHLFPRPYYARKSSGDICLELLLSSHSSPRCKSCNWNLEMLHDCSLEHQCHFGTSKSENNHACPSPNLSCITTVEEAPSCSVELQKQGDRYLDRCHGQPNHIATHYQQGLSAGTLVVEEVEILSGSVDSSSDVENESTSTISASHSLQRENKLAVDRATHHNKSNFTFPTSCSSELLQPPVSLTTSVRPGYSRAMTMPLPERPKATVTNQTLRTASFEFYQPGHHVHPKLPDYDDLAAKFRAIKKEHSKNYSPRACNSQQ